MRSILRAATGIARYSNLVSGPLSEVVLDLSRAIQALGSYLEDFSETEETRWLALEAALVGVALGAGRLGLALEGLGRFGLDVVLIIVGGVIIVLLKQAIVHRRVPTV